MANTRFKGRMRHALWVALVVVLLAVIAWWMWVYRAPPAVPAEYRQSASGAVPDQVESQQDQPAAVSAVAEPTPI